MTNIILFEEFVYAQSYGGRDHLAIDDDRGGRIMWYGILTTIVVVQFSFVFFFSTKKNQFPIFLYEQIVCCAVPVVRLWVYASEYFWVSVWERERESFNQNNNNKNDDKSQSNDSAAACDAYACMCVCVCVFV